MKSRLLTIGLIFSTLFVFSDPAFSTPSQCSSVTSGVSGKRSLLPLDKKKPQVCAQVQGKDVVITFEGVEILRIKGPVNTIVIKVPVPGPTKMVPGPTRTVLLTEPTQVPGPVRTITIFIPGPGSTRVITVTPTLTRPSPSATLALPHPQPTTVRIITREHTVTRTITRALQVGLILFLAGIAMSIIALSVSYTSGYTDAKRNEASELKKLKDELF